MISQKIIQTVAKKLNLPEDLVEKTYKNYWKWVKHCLEEVDLKGDITKEEYDKCKHSINIPSLGKFYTTWDKVNTMHTKYKKYGNKESTTNV